MLSFDNFVNTNTIIFDHRKMLTITEDFNILKNQLHGNICLERDNSGGYSYSKVYTIQGRVALRFLCMDTPQNDDLCVCIFFQFCKLNNADKNSYGLNFTSTELNISNKTIATVNKENWNLIFAEFCLLEIFNVNATVEVIEFQNTAPILSAMYDDTELTDFELKGVDGSVRVHRAVVGAASPVLRRMLSGEWREVASGRVQLADATRETLQHFKDFMYLGALPESGLRPLLLLARYLMMQELEGRCEQALVDRLTPDSSFEHLEFAFSNKLTKLAMNILKRIECGGLKVTDITAPLKTS